MSARNVRAFASNTSPSSETPALPSKPKYELKGPEAVRFKVAEGQLGNVAGASVPLLTRFGLGALTAGYKPSLGAAEEGTYSLMTVNGQALKESSLISTFKRPAQPIVIYEFDACPFCKKVREMVSYLDLDVLFYPCPRDGPNFRPKAVELGGKSMFPYMVDPNTGSAMYESDDIIAYLAREYGNGDVPLMLKLGPVTAITAGVGMIPRMGKGGKYKPAKQPKQPLVLWGYEASPFVRLVKEKLCELEIPHVFRSCARGSPKRQEMFDTYGKFQVPLMEDPNTGTAMFESAAIVQYLEDTYAL